MKNKLFLFSFLLTSLVLNSCKKEVDIKKTNKLTEQTKSVVIDEGETILGNKLQNPFTIQNMRDAYSLLSGQPATDLINTNQLYVRFRVSNVEQAKVLDERGLILSMLPLDYEILQFGTSYTESAGDNSVWMYTTVQPNFNFDGLEYERLAELFLPKLLIGTAQYESLFSQFDHEDLIDQALKLKGYDNQTTEKATKYRPKGYIRVQQKIGLSVTQVPVKNLKIRSRWWFDYGTGYTSDAGYFECNELYRKNRKVNIICIFENQQVNIRAIKGIQVFGMLFTERKNIGDFENSAIENVSYLFSNSNDENSDVKRKWMCCHAINSVREQRVYCQQNGVMFAPNNLNMWITNANNGGASLSAYAAAPMLKQMANSSLVVQVTQAFLILGGHPWAAAAVEVLEQYPPDITYCYTGEAASPNNQSDQISQTFYHELCHASHYAKVGNNYWLNYIEYIVLNGGYGEPNNPGAGRIAISEAWAEFCGARFAYLRYGTANSIGNDWLTEIENFIPYANTPDWSWIPDGVMHDLTDVGEQSFFTNVNDNVNGYTISQCFAAMDSDILAVPDYRVRFINENGTAQQAAIVTLFKSYGY